MQIEEPFAVLPLEVQHKWLLHDAEQMRKLICAGMASGSSRIPMLRVKYARVLSDTNW